MYTYISLGGPTPYEPLDLNNGLNSGIPNMGGGGPRGSNAGLGNNANNSNPKQRLNPATVNTDQMKRARVLCSYDANDHTELSLNANEVILVTECSPLNADYMYGKQGLLKGLVPRAFLDIIDDDDNGQDNDLANRMDANLSFQ